MAASKWQQLRFQVEQEAPAKPSTREQTTQTTSTSSAAYFIAAAPFNDFYQLQSVGFAIDKPSESANNNDKDHEGDIEIGRYVNWSSDHSVLSSKSWCCVGELISFCNKNECSILSIRDMKAHNAICAEIKELLQGAAPFHMRRRFPGYIHKNEDLWVCIGRCPRLEYHLNRILKVFRRPLEWLSAEKQREAKHEFQLAINELRLDISARISEVKLYDRDVFESEHRLKWMTSE